MESQLGTTNLFLGILAVTSVFELLLVIGAGIGMFAFYQRTRRAYLHVIDLMTIAEQRHVVPTLARMNAIMDDVKDVTATVREETTRLDTAIHSTIDRVEQTAGVVREIVLRKSSRLVGVMKGARAVLETILTT